MQSTDTAVLILAAGRGTRMKSEKPKVLHPLMGRPLIEHVINACLYLEPERLVVVTGFKAEDVELGVSAFIEELSGKRRPPKPGFARQAEQLGTGHAVSMAREALADFSGQLIIMSGDVPLISPNTLDGFLKAHLNLKADLSVLTVALEEPAAYGRVIRDEAGWLERIVEYRDASDAERNINEINSGLYIADSKALFQSIENLKADNAQQEYYLTDVVADFRSRGLSAAAVEIPANYAFEVQGINDRFELAQVQDFLRSRINESWMRAGVTMLDQNSVYIEGKVRLAADVTLWPGVILTGRTNIGAGAEVGPYCRLHDCLVPAGHSVPGYQNFIERDFSLDVD